MNTSDIMQLLILIVSTVAIVSVWMCTDKIWAVNKLYAVKFFSLSFFAYLCNR